MGFPKILTVKPFKDCWISQPDTLLNVWSTVCISWQSCQCLGT